jgi:hypothetical protein
MEKGFASAFVIRWPVWPSGPRRELDRARADIHDGQELKGSLNRPDTEAQDQLLQIITFGLQRAAGPYTWAMYGRRPRCKRNLTYLRSVRVQPCMRPVFRVEACPVAMQPLWLLALM